MTRRKCIKRYRPRLEVLEDRLLMAIKVWDGGSLLNDDWKTDNNWVGNEAPIAFDELVFPAGVNSTDKSTNNDFPSGTTFSKITFESSGYILDGNPIVLGQGGILCTNTATEDNIIEFDITMNSGPKPFDVRDNQFLDLRGAIKGSAGLIKLGTGEMAFGGSTSNSYSGDTEVRLGNLFLRKSAGLNAIASSVLRIAADGPAARVTVTVPEQIANTTAVIINQASSLAVVASETIGPLTLESGQVIGSGTLILNGNVSMQGRFPSIQSSLSLGGAIREFNVGPISESGSAFISGAISNGGLTKIGATLRLTGDTTNTYTGPTTVISGLLVLAKSSGATAIAGPLIIGDGQGAPATDGVIMDFVSNDQIADNAAVTVTSSGVLLMGNNSDTIGSLTLNGSEVLGQQATLALNGPLTTLASDRPARIEGHLSLGSAVRAINVADGDAADDLILFSVGEGGLIKSGSGKLVLSANFNGYSGETQVFKGILNLRNSAKPGSSTGGTTVFPGATLEIEGGNTVFGEELVLSGTGFNGMGALHSVDGINGWTGPVTLAGSSTITVDSDEFTISGAIGETAAPMSLTKQGNGTLKLSGSASNTYTGATVIHAGTLQLGKSAGAAAIAGPLTIGDGQGGPNVDIVKLASANQIPDINPVSILSSGRLDLNSFSETIGPLSLTGGTAVSIAGTLTLNGDVTTNAAPTQSFIDGRLSLGGATRTFTIADGTSLNDLLLAATVSNGGLTKAGGGRLLLNNAGNTYEGVTTINAGELAIVFATALGTTAGGTIVNTGGTLSLQNVGQPVGLEPLTLNGTGVGNAGALRHLTGTSSWAGPVTLAGSANSIGVDSGQLTLSGLIGQSGGNRPLTKTGIGTLHISGSSSNMYLGTTTVIQGLMSLQKTNGAAAVAGAVTIGDGIGGPNADVLQLATSNQIADSAAVTINSSGLLDLNSQVETIGSLTLAAGNVTTGNGTLTLTGDVTSIPAATSATIAGRLALGSSQRTFTTGAGAASPDLIVSALILSGGMRVIGQGTLALTGNNTYTGQTTIELGNLLVHGSQPNSPVVFNFGGSLGGTGRVGTVTATGGAAALINPGASPGVLTTGPLNMQLDGGAGSPGPAFFRVELNGTTPGTGHDQLNVLGAVQISNVALDVSLSAPSSVNDTFKIVNNDNTDPINGVFEDLLGNPLVEGALITLDEQIFQISYVGGDGNDVVLVHLDSAPAFQNRKVTSPVAEGQIATVTGTITEPDTRDTFFLEVNWGDGSPTETYRFAPGTPRDIAVSHRYRDDQPIGTPQDDYFIDLFWHDQHGLGNRGTLTVTVRNVQPTVFAGLDATVREGTVFTRSGYFVDPGQDRWTATVDYGDGSGSQALALQQDRFQLQHRYQSAGTYKLVVTVQDDDGGIGTVSLNVTVVPFNKGITDSLFALFIDWDVSNPALKLTASGWPGRGVSPSRLPGGSFIQ